MTRSRQLAELHRLCELSFRIQSQKVQALATQEARLRDVAARLEAARAQDLAADAADLGRKSMGADLAWQAFLDRQQRRLAIDLARVLAQQEPERAALRRHFGRVEVTATLRDRQAMADSRFRQRRNSQG